ncbi:PREDICTED: uncharacterized protein LOC109586221 isoform X1 [Amphimedon queenslandica]|nr:PREDICTED: uncharacterized protein LOC109586221 isoform X1 [Amphimedon queenslandica]|eukprot:XP_019857948.1 PREDICTED: uncharacterized protein LOC109586221 isoform X1 [Amphimedon queenslandica]
MERPWQAIYEERLKAKPVPGLRQELSTENYQKKFYDTLWYEEKEHTIKLHNKCSGVYKLFVTDDVPPEVKELALKPERYKEFGYIEDDAFTYDKIEYATQASEGVKIYKSNDFYVCKALISQHNFFHVEQRLYLCFPGRTMRMLQGRSSHRKIHFKVKMKFELKHSYFSNLQHAIAVIPQYVINCLISDKHSFSRLEEKFKPQWSKYSFMKLDDVQTQALQMITSVSSRCVADSCPPPVLLNGPFGSGKTRILARAAYEVMTNGISKGDPFTRILICAHHPQSVNSFIEEYFTRIENKEGKLPYRVFHVSRYLGNPYPNSHNSHFYMTFDELENLEPEKLENVIIIASYNGSLSLYDIIDVPGYGYFNYVFLDEAAQVREPEAITPLALATHDAKIVLAGDDKQVGPKTLVLGEEAQNDGLDVSLLTRLTGHYKGMGPTAATYMTTLSINYRAHEDLLSLPELFYGKLHASENKPVWHHQGPSGYKFVCSDSRLVHDSVAANEQQQSVEACIVLEQALLYLKETEKERKPPQICIISSTRKQLNHIKQMVYRYPCYNILKEKKVKFLPSFMIQGHQFEAIFLCLLEPLKDGKIKEYFTKSLFNHFVFNTVITRAKTLVVTVGTPFEILDFEDQYISEADGEVKCWHEYLQLCKARGTISHLEPKIEKEFDERLEKRMQQNDPAPAPLRQSRVEKDFEKLGMLGKGGFGVVYHVLHKVDKGKYAIKMIPTTSGKVKREVHALSVLYHPGIVRYYNSFIDCAPVGWDDDDAMDEPSTSFGPSNSLSVQSVRTLSPIGANHNSSGTESFSIEFRDDSLQKNRSQEKGIPTHTKSTDETLTDDATDDTTSYSSLAGYQKYLFIQMELCQRKTLRDWLSINVHNRYRIKVFNFFVQILDAVIYMHDKDYIHRDLKPSNILFAMDDSIKVGDFGLVKQNVATKHSAPQSDVQGSHTSEIGTSFYVSPEQKAGHRYNERADVYSLGIILFELYFPFSTEMERDKVLGDIKSNRRLPKEFKENFYNEAKLVELMLKPISDRPSSSEIKEMDAFKQMKDQAELNCDFILPKF